MVKSPEMNEVKRLEWSFRELVENSGDVFVVLDAEFKIRYASSSLLKLFGVDPITLLGRDIFDFVDTKVSEEYKKGIAGIVSGSSFEIALEFNKGVRTYFDAHITHIEEQNASSSGFALKLHDITVKRAKERELVKLNKQLDQVIFKTTHDLKAPLMSAIGLVNLAEKSPYDQRDEYLALIRRSLLKLSGFIEEMNHFFRNEKLALQREKIGVVNLLKEEIENLQNLYLAKKIEIDIVTDESAEFFSDMVRVKTIVTNILTNAIKYADPEKSNPFITIRVKVRTDFCEIEFEDNGIGIESELKDRIFDLFYRATSQSQGTGIGLFIVKDTVERLHGKIEVESEIGKGTTFKVKIPNQLYQVAELN